MITKPQISISYEKNFSDPVRCHGGRHDRSFAGKPFMDAVSRDLSGWSNDFVLLQGGHLFGPGERGIGGAVDDQRIV